MVSAPMSYIRSASFSMPWFFMLTRHEYGSSAWRIRKKKYILPEADLCGGLPELLHLCFITSLEESKVDDDERVCRDIVWERWEVADLCGVVNHDAACADTVCGGCDLCQERRLKSGDYIV